MTGQSTVRQPAEGRTVAFVGGIYRFIVTGHETHGKLAQWELTVPPGNAPPLHVHSREDETFFVTQGEVSFQVEKHRIIAPTGTLIHMPIGVPHTFKNETTVVAKMLISVSPAGLEHFFFEIGEELEPGCTIVPTHKLEIQRIIEVSARYGVEILIP